MSTNMSTKYRVFCRTCWKPDTSWPDGYAPKAYPMDKCRTLETFYDLSKAVSYCEERNHKWRQHADRVRIGTASAAQKRTYYTATRYEFTHA